MTSIVAIAVNRRKQIFLMEDDTIIPFACMLDEFGIETDDPFKCITVIYQLPNGRFAGIALSEFEGVSVQ